MAEPNENPSQKMIYDLVRQPTHDALQHEIDTKLHTVRSGIVDQDGDGIQDENASFWDMIKAFFMKLIFNFAEAFGFEKGLAKMFGMPIPENKEVDALSHQVASSMSHSLANDSMKFSNREEFKTELHNRLLGDLHAARSNYGSFNNEQLAETARRTVETIAPQFDALFDESGTRKNNSQSPATHLLAATTFTDKFKAAAQGGMLDKLKMLSNNPNFNERDIGYISTALAPTLVEFKTQKPTDFSAVSGRFKTALMGNKSLLERSGASWSPERLEILADHLTVKYMELEHKVVAPVEFTTALADKESNQAAAIGTGMIQSQVEDAISANVATGTIEAYYKTTTGWGYGGALSTIKTLEEEYYTKQGDDYVLRQGVNPNDPDLKKLHIQLHQFAATDGWTKNHAPTIAQSQKISEVVAQAVVDTLKKNPSAEGNARDALIKDEIKKALKAHNAEINAAGPAGHTIEAIDAQRRKNNKPAIYDMVAEKFVTTMNVDGHKKEVDDLHKALAAPAVTSAQSAALNTSYIPTDPVNYKSFPPLDGTALPRQSTRPYV